MGSASDGQLDMLVEPDAVVLWRYVVALTREQGSCVVIIVRGLHRQTFWASALAHGKDGGGMSGLCRSASFGRDTMEKASDRTQYAK